MTFNPWIAITVDVAINAMQWGKCLVAKVGGPSSSDVFQLTWCTADWNIISHTEHLLWTHLSSCMQ